MTNSTEPLPTPPPGDAPRYRYCEPARIPRHRGRRACAGGNTFPPDDFGTERWLPPPDPLEDDDPPPVEGGETSGRGVDATVASSSEPTASETTASETTAAAASAASARSAASFGNADVPQQHLREPGEFIAAVPAMLGFVPARSLVLAVLRAEAGRADTAAVDVVVRVDTDVAGRAAARAVLDQLADICVRQRAVAALALIVDDRATVPDARHRGVRARRHRELNDLLAARLAAAGVALTGTWAIAGFEAGRPWWSVPEPADTGAQRAPADSPVTFRQVLDGRPLRGSRAELAAVVAVDTDARAAVEAVLESVVAAAQARLAAAARRGESEVYTRTALRKVLWQIANIESGARLHPAELAELAVALRNPVVRDVMFALAPGDHAAAAETLWIHLARALPDPDRAEAAALLGYCAYVRGDGPLAGVALEAALASDPDHTMARLLETALRNGLRPTQLRRIAETGREAAAILGVDLGPELS
ncbi:DUF4192 domain-containing protein [Nocardia sp. CC227C]|uniref:DUF4192 domain-containing protein n=1 Tax=Nocardia sp. CC227C TaxID=3044562 RepID=UPI00278C2BAB|nr:DUF4192 domain-containing protein [Nocardia sp. CC227C]